MGGSDSDLVESARQGDKDAFGRLVMRHRAVLVALCRRMLSEPALAEDAAHEAVVIALLNLDQLRTPERFGPWLVGIGLNVCRQWRRPGRCRRWAWQPLIGGSAGIDVPDPGLTPEEIGEASELRSLVRAAVSELPDGQRAAVTRFYLEGLTYQESAASLDIRVSALKTRLHKARAALRRRLSPVREEPTMNGAQPVPMRVLDVHRLGEGLGDVHVVMLGEVEGSRRLAIWVGPYEATGIALALVGAEPPRPFPWQLTARLLNAAGRSLHQVRIARIEDGTFYATIRLGDVGDEVDARPSDAINLALVMGTPITADEAVLEAVRAQESRTAGQTPDAVVRRATAGASEIVESAMTHWPR